MTLIKNALSNFPVYYMSLLRAPASVLHSLVRIRPDFLWHSEEGERKYHLVS